MIDRLPFTLQKKILTSLESDGTYNSILSRFQCRQVCYSWNKILKITEIEKFRLQNHYKRHYFKKMLSVESNFKLLEEDQHLIRFYLSGKNILPNIALSGQVDAFLVFTADKRVSIRSNLTADIRFSPETKSLSTQQNLPYSTEIYLKDENKTLFFINYVQVLKNLLNIRNVEKAARMYNFIPNLHLSYFSEIEEMEKTEEEMIENENNGNRNVDIFMLSLLDLNDIFKGTSSSYLPITISLPESSSSSSSKTISTTKNFKNLKYTFPSSKIIISLSKIEANQIISQKISISNIEKVSDVDELNSPEINNFDEILQSHKIIDDLSIRFYFGRNLECDEGIDSDSFISLIKVQMIRVA